MTISLTNGKGGTGKTTLNLFLAKALIERGFSALLVDLDANCSASEALGKVLCDNNSRQLLTGRPVKPYTVAKSESGGRLDLIPSDLDLDMIANVPDTALKMQLNKWNAQTRNALFAAESVLVVGKCSPLDLAATSNYMQKLQDCGLDADVCVVVNGYNSRSDPGAVFEKYKERFGEWLLPCPIPRMNSLKRLAANINYAVRPDLAARLEEFVRAATLGKISERTGRKENATA